MYPIPTGGIVEVRLVGLLAGQQIMSVLHYQYTGIVGPITDGKMALGQLIGQLQGAGNLCDKYAACLSEDAGPFNIYAQLIYPQRFAYVVDFMDPLNGTVAHPAEPANVAIAVTKRGDGVGPHEHGTLHLPAIPQTFVEGSLISFAAAAPLAALCAELQATVVIALGGSEFRPVIFNRAAPVTSAFITDSFPEQTMRVQRRRTVGLGK